MTKKAKLYCEAINAITNGKVPLLKLRQYKKALLNIPSDMDQSSASYQMLFLSREKFNTIIERKKERFWSITKPFLIGLILVLITFFLSFFFLRNNTNIDRQPLPPQMKPNRQQPLQETQSKNRNISKQPQSTQKSK